MNKILSLLLVLTFLGCNSGNPESAGGLKQLQDKITALENKLKSAEQDETKFIHTVFFWVNEGVTEEQKADFAKNGLTALLKVPSIYKGYFGSAAMTPREVVDNSYDFALVCHFKNTADQDKYQEDPIHLKFIEDYKHLWKKVQVYDNLVE